MWRLVLHMNSEAFVSPGLSPDLQSMEQIRRIMRPTDVPDQGLLCDLLWSDPDKDVLGWGENDRGVSFTFGAEVVAKFLHKHDLDLICRAHQVVEDGYEFFAKRQLVTLFSAPNYCGEFDNAGAMMSVDETLMCSFQILKPAEKKKPNSSRPVTPPRNMVTKQAKKWAVCVCLFLDMTTQCWCLCVCVCLDHQDRLKHLYHHHHHHCVFLLYRPQIHRGAVYFTVNTHAYTHTHSYTYPAPFLLVSCECAIRCFIPHFCFVFPGSDEWCFDADGLRFWHVDWFFSSIFITFRLHVCSFRGLGDWRPWLFLSGDAAIRMCWWSCSSSSGKSHQEKQISPLFERNTLTVNIQMMLLFSLGNNSHFYTL